VGLRDLGSARLRRAAGGRPGFVGLVSAVFLAGALATTAPAIWHPERFLSGSSSGHGEPSAGDHLQTAYRLWLVGHQLVHGHAPWLDPYSFRPESGARLNPGGWPFGLPYWPLEAAFGQIWAWNLFVLLTFVAAGWLAYLWLRELGLGPFPAVLGGLAFEAAPYRAAQSAGHLLGPISILLPLTLWAFERGRRGSRWWLLLAGAALASIPLSGQVHLALGAIPFFALYASCRTRDRTMLGLAAGCVAAAVGAGILIDRVSISGTLGSGGRSLREVSSYSADGLDFLVRRKRHGSETFVFLGWLTPAAAIAGLWLLWREQRRDLFSVLGLGAVVPVLLALGTHLPVYSLLWHALPPFRYPRVPERLMPIACLSIAGLVAFAAAEVKRIRLPAKQERRRAAVALLVVLLLLDLHATVFGASAADASNQAYAAIRREPPGRLLELPVFLPDVHFGSVYLYYDMQARRQRPGGYSTTAPVAADQVARRLRRLSCGDWTRDRAGILGGLGVRAIAFHAGVYGQSHLPNGEAWLAWRELLANGWRPLATDGAVTAFVPGRSAPGAVPPVSEPRRDDLLFCEGWYGPSELGRQMASGHAPLWAYGSGTLRLFVSSPKPLDVVLGVDGAPQETRRISRLQEVQLALADRRWHLVTFDVPRLAVVAGRPQGVRVEAYVLP
jgi:hypothetical protein